MGNAGGNIGISLQFLIFIQENIQESFEEMYVCEKKKRKNLKSILPDLIAASDSQCG